VGDQGCDETTKGELFVGLDAVARSTAAPTGEKQARAVVEALPDEPEKQELVPLRIGGSVELLEDREMGFLHANRSL
jgi:hypothetical protein